MGRHPYLIETKNDNMVSSSFDHAFVYSKTSDGLKYGNPVGLVTTRSGGGYLCQLHRNRYGRGETIQAAVQDAYDRMIRGDLLPSAGSILGVDRREDEMV